MISLVAIALSSVSYTHLRAHETRGKYQLIKKVSVKNLLKRHATEITFSDIVINSGLSDKIFNDINLRRLPLE